MALPALPLFGQSLVIVCEKAVAADLSVLSEIIEAVATYCHRQHAALQHFHTYYRALNAATCVRRNATTVSLAACAAELTIQSPHVQLWIQERTPRLPLPDTCTPSWEIFVFHPVGCHLLGGFGIGLRHWSGRTLLLRIGTSQPWSCWLILW